MWGAFHFVRSVRRQMVEQNQGGNVVVIGSPHAHMAIPGAMAYNMAGRRMTRCTGPQPASLSTPYPGQYHSPWLDRHAWGTQILFEETLKAEGAKLPWGRLGKPEESGEESVFCATQEASTSGSTLTIDGGIQLPWREMYRINEKPEWIS